MKKNIIIFLSIILIFSVFAVGAVYFNGYFSRPNVNLAQKEEIKVGINTSDANEIAKYQIIIDYLNRNSSDRWVLSPVKDYGSFITQIELKQIKAGFVGSAVGYRLIKENMAIPIARGEKDGIADYYSYIFTKKDSGINNLSDLKDKKFAYVDINTSAGYFFPVYLIKQNGFDPENFFRVASFLGTHKNAIYAVLNGDYEAGAAKDSAWRKIKKTDLTTDLDNNMVIIAKGGPFPEQTFMVSIDFGGKKASDLKYLFLNMANTQEGKKSLAAAGIDRFIDTKEEDFTYAKKIIDY